MSTIIDPVCAFHGLRRSEHNCLYCCLCFETLTPEECAVIDGERWDMCVSCAEEEEAVRSEVERSRSDDGGEKK